MADFLLLVNTAGSLTAVETSIKTTLEDGGANTVTTRTESDGVPADISPYDAMVASPDITRSYLDDWNTQAIGILNCHPAGCLNLDLASAFNLSGSTTDIYVNDGTHATSGDLVAGTNTVFSTAQDYNGASSYPTGSGITLVAQQGSADTDAVILAVESGATILNAHVAEDRRVMFMIGSKADALNANGNSALLDSALWAGSVAATVKELTLPGALTFTLDMGSGLGAAVEGSKVPSTVILRALQSAVSKIAASTVWSDPKGATPISPGDIALGKLAAARGASGWVDPGGATANSYAERAAAHLAGGYATGSWTDPSGSEPKSLIDRALAQVAAAVGADGYSDSGGDDVGDGYRDRALRRIAAGIT